MFRKLINTTDDPAVTILRLVPWRGVLRATVAQKVARLVLAGYGFSGTMAFFTQQAHIPAALALSWPSAPNSSAASACFSAFSVALPLLALACNMVVAVAMVPLALRLFSQTGSAIKRAKALSTTFLRSPSPWPS